MTQTATASLFDLIAAIELGERGIELAAGNHASAVWDAQQIAKELGRRQRFVSMNDVNRRWAALGRRREELGNGAGSVFRGKCWRRTSQQVRAEHLESHGRWLPIWEYLGE